MATDFSKPVASDGYAALLSSIQTAINDLAKQLEPTATGANTNVPANAIRWNNTNKYWELYSGTAWAALAATYAISITGNAASATTAAACSGNAATASTVAWSGVTGKPTTVGGYGITDAITTANIGSQSVNYAASAGSAGSAGSANALNAANAYTVAGLTSSGQITRTVAGADGTQRVGALVVNKANGTIRYQFGIEADDAPILWTYDNLGAYTGSIKFAGGSVTATGQFNGSGAGLTNLPPSGLGVGQVWTNYTGSKALGTTYNNSTGKPIFINVQCATSGGATEIHVLISGTYAVYGGGYNAGATGLAVSCIIPIGADYSVWCGGSGQTVTSWIEFR